jgi:peptidylprolyl isomerase
VRRLAAGLLLVPALLLTGCSSSTKAKSADSASSQASPSAPAQVPVPPVVDTTDNLPAVTGAFGTTPVVKVPTAKPDGKFVVHALTEGSGAKLAQADIAIYHFSAVDWNTGKTLPQADAYGKDSAPTAKSPSAGMLPAFSSALVGHAVGSRVEVVAPPGALTAQLDPASLPSLGVKATDTIILVVDLNQRVDSMSDVKGTQAAPAADVPSVSAPAGKPATFTITDAVRKPTTLKTDVLIKGTGPKVLGGQYIVVQYTGATLSDGKVFDSSWSHPGAYPTLIGANQVIKGWDQGLVGQTVGSRVLLSIPSALAYGTAGNSGIAPNADLVFVVDIIAAA